MGCGYQNGGCDPEKPNVRYGSFKQREFVSSHEDGRGSKPFILMWEWTLCLHITRRSLSWPSLCTIRTRNEHSCSPLLMILPTSSKHGSSRSLGILKAFWGVAQAREWLSDRKSSNAVNFSVYLGLKRYATPFMLTERGSISSSRLLLYRKACD